MVPSKRQGYNGCGNSLYRQCKGELLREKTVKNPQQTSKQIGISADLTGLREDLVELNQVLCVVKRSAVKDAILVEIRFATAKIDSLHSLRNPTVENVSKNALWSEVVGKKKKPASATQLATYNIPVSINRYNQLAHEEGCRRNSATNRSRVVQSEYDEVNKIDAIQV